MITITFGRDMERIHLVCRVSCLLVRLCGILDSFLSTQNEGYLCQAENGPDFSCLCSVSFPLGFSSLLTADGRRTL